MREKVGKSRKTVFFQWFGAPEGRKVGSLKRRVRSQLARWEMKSCTPLWREADFQVKMYKTHQLRTTFGSWDVKKVHAVVARSTFPSQNVQNTPSFGPLLEVEMSKKCTPLWREVHFEVKMLKTLGVRTTFGSWDVEKVHAVVARSTFRSQNVQTPRVRATFGGSDVEKVHAVVARSTFPSQNVQNTTCSRHFWRFRCRFASLHYITLHYTPQHYNNNYTTTQLHSTTLHYTELHSATLHYTKLHSTTLHYLPLHFTTLHCTTLHSTTLQLQLQLHNYTPLHSTTLNYTTLHYTTLHYSTIHYTTLLPLHFTTWH